MSRAVMQQALEYLDAPSAKLWPAGTQHQIITALKQALAEPEQEPVLRYDGLYEYASQHGLDYNDLCRVVRAAHGITGETK